MKDIKLSDEYDAPDIEVSTSLMELDELLQQRLENIPKGEVSLRQWRKEVNWMVQEVNSIVGWNKYKKV